MIPDDPLASTLIGAQASVIKAVEKLMDIDKVRFTKLKNATFENWTRDPRSLRPTNVSEILFREDAIEIEIIMRRIYGEEKARSYVQKLFNLLLVNKQPYRIRRNPRASEQEQRVIQNLLVENHVCQIDYFCKMWE